MISSFVPKWKVPLYQNEKFFSTKMKSSSAPKWKVLLYENEKSFCIQKHQNKKIFCTKMKTPFVPKWKVYQNEKFLRTEKFWIGSNIRDPPQLLPAFPAADHQTFQ